MELNDFRVLTFDCYGTLIDWESGIIKGLEPLIDQRAFDLDRNGILQAHAKYESAQQKQTPYMSYRDILAIVYKRLAEEWGVAATWEDCLQYGQSVKNWPAFPDSAEALRYLKAHYKLVILSNVDNQSFAASQAKLGVQFEAIYTAQDIGSYKPADANFEYMVRHLQALGFDKRAILHTAESLFHDHQPANRHGLASCWIYRRHAQEGYGATMTPGDRPSYDFRFNSMAEMVAAHQKL